MRPSKRRTYFHVSVRIDRCGSYAAWYVPSAKIASRTCAGARSMSGISEWPCTKSGTSMSGQLADRRVEVDLRHERFAHRRRRQRPGPRRMRNTPVPPSVIVAFAPRERDAVIGRADHERVVGQALRLERVEHRADARDRASAALSTNDAMSRRVVGTCRAGSPAVGSIARRRARARRSAGASRRSRPKEERLRRRSAEELDRGRRDVVDTGRVDLHHAVVADDVGPLRDVLLADQRRVVPDLAQRVHDVMAVVVAATSRGARGPASRCCARTAR